MMIKQRMHTKTFHVWDAKIVLTIEAVLCSTLSKIQEYFFVLIVMVGSEKRKEIMNPGWSLFDQFGDLRRDI